MNAQSDLKFLNQMDSVNSVRTQIKICGVTSTKDAEYAMQFGADAVGLVFYKHSTRNLAKAKAMEIRQVLAKSTTAVGVVVDPTDDLLEMIISDVQVDAIQFHGEESPERCRQLGIPYIKAQRVRSTEQILNARDLYTDAKALLLDAYEPSKVGGTGQTFSWELIPELDIPVILAGGLTSDNVGEAIRKVRPSAVDVSTGVEVSGGIKDPESIQKFSESVLAADESLRDLQ